MVKGGLSPAINITVRDTVVRHVENRAPHEDRPTPEEAAPQNTWSQQNLEEAEGPSRASRDGAAVPTPSSLVSGTVSHISIGSSRPVCGALFGQPQSSQGQQVPWSGDVR